MYVRAHLGAERADDAGDDLRPLRFRRLDPRRRERTPRLRLIGLQVLVALGAIVGGAVVFVDAVGELAAGAGVDPTIMTLVIAPIATELPEKFNSVIWIRQGKDTLSMGNITGAMVFQNCIPTVLALLLAADAWTVTPASLATPSASPRSLVSRQRSRPGAPVGPERSGSARGRCRRRAVCGPRSGGPGLPQGRDPRSHAAAVRGGRRQRARAGRRNRRRLAPDRPVGRGRRPGRPADGGRLRGRGQPHLHRPELQPGCAPAVRHGRPAAARLHRRGAGGGKPAGCGQEAGARHRADPFPAGPRGRGAGPGQPAHRNRCDPARDQDQARGRLRRAQRGRRPQGGLRDGILRRREDPVRARHGRHPAGVQRHRETHRARHPDLGQLGLRRGGAPQEPHLEEGIGAERVHGPQRREAHRGHVQGEKLSQRQSRLRADAPAQQPGRRRVQNRRRQQNPDQEDRLQRQHRVHRPPAQGRDGDLGEEVRALVVHPRGRSEPGHVEPGRGQADRLLSQQRIRAGARGRAPGGVRRRRDRRHLPHQRGAALQAGHGRFQG